jgi:hypothetical protein
MSKTPKQSDLFATVRRGFLFQHSNAARALDSIEEQLEALRRVAENVRDGWLVEHVDDAQLDKALHDLDAWLQASSPASEPKR